MPAENPPTAPDSLPKYLRKGLPKQDVPNLHTARDYIDQLLDWKQRPVEDDELPEKADPIEDESEGRRGTVVMEKVTCGDETCKCLRKGRNTVPTSISTIEKRTGRSPPIILTTSKY